MDHIEWLQRPDVSDVTLLAAFTGWNDAGDAASEACNYLARRYDAEPVARIDPEFFYDFASVRPTVRLEGDNRVLDWPRNEFRLGRLDDGRNLLIVSGIEPRLRWKTFAQAAVDVATALDVTTAITLGALLTETHHAQPVEVIGASSNQELNIRLGLAPSSYEGPTGIVGVLNDAFHRAGFDSLSFWGAVPSYVGQSASPKATLALVERVVEFLDIPLAATDLQIAAASYERQVDELVASDPELAAYAERLRQMVDEEPDDQPALENDPEALIDELEEFLRQQDD